MQPEAEAGWQANLDWWRSTFLKNIRTDASEVQPDPYTTTLALY